MKCKKIMPNGNQCQSYTTHSSEFCFRHDKNTKSKALEASSEGGKAKKRYLTLGEPMSIKTPEDIKVLMEKSINKLWTGEMPAGNPAGALGYLAKIFLEAYEKNDLEIRIEQLEKRLDQSKI